MKYLALLITSSLSASTLIVKNDSPSTLNAEIYSSQGKDLGSMTLTPGVDVQWLDPYGGQMQGFSTSPYTILWSCQSGKEFGVSYEVSAGSTSEASGSEGIRACQGED